MNYPKFFTFGADYADLAGPAIEAPPQYHYGVLLTVIGARLGRRLWFPYGRRVYPNLYTCLVGPSGLVRKSTSMNIAQPLMKGIVSLKGLSTAEGLLQCLQRTPTMLVEMEELSALYLKARNEKSAGLVPMLAQLYDCPDRMDLPTRANPIVVERPTLSILSSTTPEWLEKSMSQADVFGGSANRYLFLVGNFDTPRAFPYEPDLVEFSHRVDKALSRWKKESIGLGWEEEAKELWEGFYNNRYDRARTQDETTRVLGIRVAVITIKVAMIIHALEGNGPVISAETLSSAITFMEYAEEGLNEIRPLFSSLETKILHILQEKPLTRSRLHQVIGGRTAGGQLVQALSTLVKFKRVEEVEGKFMVKEVR